jgi:phytoene desaturase
MNQDAKGLKAVVIGSGFGGLAAAIRLQARGAQVTLIEQRERLGGRAYRLQKKGYTFDMGPSLITAPKVLDALFQVAGTSLKAELDLLPLDPYYRVFFHDGSRFEYNGTPENMRAQMGQFNPKDADRYDDFMRAIQPIYAEVIEKGLGSKPFHNPMTMARFIPTVIRMGAWRTATQFVNRFFKDWRNRFVFSFHPLYIGGHPFHCPAIYLMIPFLERAQGVYYTKGGMTTVVQAMAKVFMRLGGDIRTSTPAEEILTHNRQVTGVRLKNEILPADLVVSNADVAFTYNRLMPSITRRKWTQEKVNGQHFTMSCFLLFLGSRKRYPKLAHHTLILAERYKELLDDIFGKKILPNDFSMYAHAPTRSDDSMAPEGGESLMVLIPVANNASGLNWSELKAPFADKVIDFLEKWGLTDLRSHLDVMEMFTPDDFTQELSAHLGNAFGIEPRLSQTGYFRPHNRSEEVDGLYLVGAGTHPGAGVPGVLLSAETAEHCIDEDLPRLHSRKPRSQSGAPETDMSQESLETKAA